MSDLFVCVVYGVVRLIVIPHRENVVLVRRRQGGTSKFEFAREPMLVRLAKPRGRYALEATPGDCSAARVSAPLLLVLCKEASITRLCSFALHARSLAASHK